MRAATRVGGLAAALVSLVLTAGMSASAQSTVPVLKTHATAVFSSSVQATVLGLLAKAHEGDTVDVELYELGAPAVVSGLTGARHRGATVDVILDPTESQSIASAPVLRAAGITVRWGKTSLWPESGGIDHVKVEVFEGPGYPRAGIGLLGGDNLGQASSANQDGAVEVSGAALLRFFNADWSAAGGARTPDPVGPVLTGPAILKGVEYLCEHAQGTLVVEANFLSSYEAQSALAAAAKRGVRVQVLLTKGEYGAASAMSWLRAHGVQVRYGAPAAGWLHAKWAATSNGLVLIGSANWSYSALGSATVMPRNHEADLLIQNTGTATTFMQHFRHDWSLSG